MPHPQTNLRLHPDTRAKAIAAAKDAGLSLSAYTERALIAYMDRVGGVIPGDSTEIPGLGDVVSDLVARVERIEQHLAQPSPPQPSPHHPASSRITPPKPQAISHIGEAVIAAGLCDIEWPRHKPITEAHCKGSNLNEMLKARTGMKAAEWLRGQGWTKGQDGKWYSPV